MSVTKANVPYKQPHGYRERIWGIENISLWTFKMILNMCIFFIILYIAEYEFNIRADGLIFFCFIFLNYVIAGISGFLLSFAVVKLMFGHFMHRRVRSLKMLTKGKRRMKKLWIYIFTILFQTIFFILSVNAIIAGNFPLVDWLAYFLTWIILWIITRVLGRILYFVFYTW